MVSACQSSGSSRLAQAPASRDDCAIFDAVLADARFTEGRRFPPVEFEAAPGRNGPSPWTVRDSYRRISGVSEKQLREIEEDEAAAATGPYRPDCDWDSALFGSGEADPRFPETKPRTRLHRPALTRDGQLAVVTVHAGWRPLDAIGYDCLLTRAQGDWRVVRCDVIWVS